MKTFKNQIESKDFKPHMMYDPKTGKGYKAEKEKDHLRMKDMGYTHDKPEVKEGDGLWHNINKKRKEGRPMRKPGEKGAPTKQDFKNARGEKDLASKVRKEEIIHNSEITLLEKQIEELSKFLATKVKGGGVGKHSDKLKKLQRELDAMQKSKFGKSADNSDEDAINNKKNANRKDLRFKPDSYDKIDLKKYHKYSGAKQHVNAESKTFSDFKSSLYEDAPTMSMGGGHIASRDILLGNPNHDKMIRRNMTPIDTEDKRYKKKKRQGETVMLKRFKGNF